MKKKATLYLPKNGKENWTRLMEGADQEYEDILPFQPLVLSSVRYRNGITVVGGVAKSETPLDYNIKFFYVFDKNGNRLPDLIDPSDDEDFRESKRIFYLNFEEAGDQ